jgi:hypothetical protein
MRYTRIKKHDDWYTKIEIYEPSDFDIDSRGHYDYRPEKIITTYWIKSDNLDDFINDYNYINNPRINPITEGDLYCYDSDDKSIIVKKNAPTY